MTDQAITHADLIAAALAAEGVERAYGLPGGEVVTLIEACRRRQIEFHLIGHEASAAFMAATEGRITGRPGVCITTLGPGATNLGTGLAHAFLDREPLAAFSATLATTTDPGYTHQRLSLIDLFSGITKRSLLLSGQDTEETVRDALALARADRPGPVSLLLPSDVARAEATAAGRREPTVYDARDRSGAPEALEDAAALITDSARPLVMVGLGVNPRTAGGALAAFLDAGRYPVVTTPKIKGILSEEDPRWMGVVGGMAGDGQMRRLIEESDLLIAVGFDPVECDADWFVGRRVLAIDSVDGAGGGYQPVLSLLGDPAEILAGLARRVGTERGWDPAFLRGHLNTLQDIVSPHPTGDGGLSPAEVAHALRNVLPRDGILTCDVGSHKLLLGQVWTTYEPLTFFMSNGLSSMGYGLPAAAAAQLCFPQRAVCCVTGDGGMLMTLHMLEYLRRKRLPVVTVVLTDQSLSLIRLAQERRGLRPTGVDFRAPAFATVAQGFGIEARRVSTIGELSRAFAAALEAREPSLLDVPVDAREYASQM